MISLYNEDVFNVCKCYGMTNDNRKFHIEKHINNIIYIIDWTAFFSFKPAARAS